ncbi:MAG: GNAT family N-acetyltransferase [Bacteroidetes bacterium]|nr:MAG: GNAT family N-acetyltransferase [Bacteroidota bacterium]
MHYKIRQAEESDLNTLVGFQLKMALETEDLKLDKQVLSNGISAGLRDENKATYFVAENKNIIVGTLMITKEWSDWRYAWVIWIQSVYVDEAYRGKGIYRALYNYIKDKVKNDSTIGGIRLYVDKTNTIAQKVYTNLGMNGDHYQLFEDME